MQKQEKLELQLYSTLRVFIVDSGSERAKQHVIQVVCFCSAKSAGLFERVGSFESVCPFGTVGLYFFKGRA